MRRIKPKINEFTYPTLAAPFLPVSYNIFKGERKKADSSEDSNFFFLLPPKDCIKLTVIGAAEKGQVNLILYIRGSFNKFPDFFVKAFKIVIDS